MDWNTILPGIAALLAKLTGLQTFERDSPPKATDPKLKAKLEFAVTACSTVGRDERRYAYDQNVTDPNTRVTVSINGNRQFTLSVKCISYDHGYTKSAEYFLERIYTRLSFPSSQAALNTAGVAWVGAAPFVNLSALQGAEDRIFSIGQKDLFFIAAVTQDASSTDPDDALLDGPMGTIDSVEVTSVYLYGVDGNPLAKQIGPVTLP